MTAQQIANELGVRYLIEGSVQRDLERVRVNVQLIDGRNGNHIWAEHYDQKYEDLFALQDQITMAVMAFLNVKITGYAVGGEKDFRPSNLKAYEYYLRGLYYHHGRSPKDLLPARQALEEAINLDPNFGAAYAWLGHVFIDEIYFRKTKSPGKVLERAEKLANKALSISQSHGYGLLSAISRLRKDFNNAILYGEKCRDQRPHDSGPHFMLAMALLFSSRFEEAISSMEIALQLAPFRPLNYLIIFGWALNGNNQYDRAILIFTEIIERGQNKRHILSAYRGLTVAYELSGNHEKALWAAENLMRINPEFSIAAYEKTLLTKGAFTKRALDAYRRAGLPE
jgi:adenylate cyclase